MVYIPRFMAYMSPKTLHLNQGSDTPLYGHMSPKSLGFNQGLDSLFYGPPCPNMSPKILDLN